MAQIFDIKPQSKVLLVEPPFYRFFGYERWNYPLTLTLLATYLEELGHEVRVYDADRPSADCKPLNRSEVRNNYHRYEAALSDMGHPIWQEVRETIANYQPDVVALTSISAKIDSADLIAAMVKRSYGSSVRTVLGGPHVQGMRAMDANYDFGSDYDQVVTRVPNLINRKPNKKLILDHDKYSAANFSSIMTMNGCPNTCTFCCHSYEKSMVYKDLHHLEEEIAELQRDFQGAAPVDIMDDCVFSNTKHFEKVIDLLADHGLSYSAGSRIMALSPEKIGRFVKKGGKRISVGVESGSQQVLDRVEKRLKINSVIERTAWLRDAGIPWTAYFVVGLPFESLDDLKQTEELIQRIRPSFVSLNRFAPYPGTDIYREFYSGADIRFRDLFQLNAKSSVRHDEEIESYIDAMFDNFDSYNRASRP